jgi:hypothetical protein
MVHDYSRRYSSVMGSRQQVRTRAPQSAAPFLLSRVLGSVMVLILVSGVCLSIWLKMRIDQDLSELGRRLEHQQQLLGEQQKFKEHREQEQTVGAMAERARLLGLSMPDDSQIRKP